MKTLAIVASLLIAASAANTASAADVTADYSKHCASCHGKTGDGNTKAGRKLKIKDYTDAKVQAELRDDKALKSLQDGMKNGSQVLMKPFGKTLEEAELKALIEHMRTFKK